MKLHRRNGRTVYVCRTPEDMAFLLKWVTRRWGNA